MAKQAWRAGLIGLLLFQSACAAPVAVPRPQAVPIGAAAAQAAVMSEAEAEQREPEPTSDLQNFHELEPGLYRSARPSDAGLRQLQAMGVKTIVNLEGNLVRGKVEHEIQVAKSLGIQVIRLPMSPLYPPSQKQIDTFLKLTQDPNLRPLLFHCKHGKDRTGTMAYVYRVTVHRWTADKAWAEMEANGFNHIWVGLWAFVKQYGKRHAPPAAAPAV